MRPSSDSHSEIKRAPKKFAATTPVSSRMAKVSTTPRPGMCTPSTLSGCTDSGSSNSVWSSVLTRKASTQIVMPIGTQTSRPAITYRFMRGPRDGAAPSVAGIARAAAASRGTGGRAGRRFRLRVGRLGFGLAFRFRRRARVAGGRFGVAVALRGFGLAARALEIGGVPAAALELEAGGRQKLAQARLAAGRAIGERRIGQFLQRFELLPAGVAAVFVDRHAFLRKLREGSETKQEL